MTLVISLRDVLSISILPHRSPINRRGRGFEPTQTENCLPKVIRKLREDSGPIPFSPYGPGRREASRIQYDQRHPSGSGHSLRDGVARLIFLHY
jgi:hypothetical protein